MHLGSSTLRIRSTESRRSVPSTQLATEHSPPGGGGIAWESVPILTLTQSSGVQHSWHFAVAADLRVDAVVAVRRWRRSRAPRPADLSGSHSESSGTFLHPSAPPAAVVGAGDLVVALVAAVQHRPQLAPVSVAQHLPVAQWGSGSPHVIDAGIVGAAVVVLILALRVAATGRSSLHPRSSSDRPRSPRGNRGRPGTSRSCRGSGRRTLRPFRSGTPGVPYSRPPCRSIRSRRTGRHPPGERTRSRSRRPRCKRRRRRSPRRRNTRRRCPRNR